MVGATIPPFSPCGRRWQREALTDEGLCRAAATRRLQPANRTGHGAPSPQPSPARGEGVDRGTNWSSAS
jgi:hypothetical protein